MMDIFNVKFPMVAMLATLIAACPVFAEPDEATVAEEAVRSADAALALDASTLSAAFDAAGIMAYRCRQALKDFEKAIADANASAVAQRAKVAEITKTYLKNAMDKARTDGDLDKVLVFQKALETVDGEIAGDAEEIVKLRDGRAAQLEKIDKGLVASSITAANAFHAALEWQKKEITQKGEIETALKVSAFQKQVEEWTKKTKDAASAHSSATTGGRVSSRAASEVRRPAAPVRQPIRETRPVEPEAKIYTVDSCNGQGTSIGFVRAGDTLEFQYVGGKWACWSHPVVSPDDKSLRNNDERVRVCKKEDINYILALIPSGTAESPFQYVVDEDDAGEIVLRMHDKDSSNTGAVRYSVKIIPGKTSRAEAGSHPAQPSWRQPMQPFRQPPSVGAKIVTVDARSENGTSIGRMKAGDTIEIQYVDGMWTDNIRKWPLQSPDELDIHKEIRLRLVNRSYNSVGFSIVPGGSQGTPFEYIVQENRADEYALRINDFGSTDDNAGSVRYSVRIIPAGGRVSSRAAVPGDSRPSAPAVTPSSASGRVSNKTLTGTQTDTSVTLSKTLTPHVIRDQYVVPQDKELIVEAGATIIFEKNASLYCEGTLTMSGTEQSPIICKGKMQTAGYWKGIVVGANPAHISGVSISGANDGLEINPRGIWMEGRPAIISNCKLQRNGNGLKIHGKSAANIENCLISDNSETGIFINRPDNAGVSIKKCSITNNRKYGIEHAGWGRAIIVESSIISGNGESGVRCGNWSTIIHASDCIFGKNRKYDIVQGSANKQDFRHNWWGDSVTRLLQSGRESGKLPNINIENTKAQGNIIDVAEFLAEPPKDCGATVRW